MTPSPFAPSVTTCLRLAKALDHARRGQLKAAQAVLALGSQLPEDALELQALAALVTREGEFERALHLWRTLEQRSPGHAEARRMIAAIELWQARPPWYRFLPWVAGAVAVLVLVLLASIALSDPPRPAPPAKPAAGLITPVNATPAAPPAQPPPAIQFGAPKKKTQSR